MAVLRGAVFFAAFLCAGLVLPDEPKPIEIPLKDIWASRMPGTIDVRELEPNVYGHNAKSLSIAEQQRAYETSLVKQIVVALADQPTNQVAEPGFAVPGVGLEALRAAHAVIVHNKKPESISPDSNASLVFFSHESNYYVNITRIERQNDVFQIRFRFIPHESKDATVHFALIPIGKLPTGKYSVDIIQTPLDHSALQEKLLKIDEESARKYVCQPFSFVVDGNH